MVTLYLIYTLIVIIFFNNRVLLPITNDANAMHSQHEQFGAMCFLMSLPLALSTAY